MTTINISLDGFDENIKDLLRKVLLIEDNDKPYVSISSDTISISCDAISRCRAIMNSYIFWIYTVLSTLNEVNKNGGKNTS